MLISFVKGIRIKHSFVQSSLCRRLRRAVRDFVNNMEINFLSFIHTIYRQYFFFCPWPGRDNEARKQL